MKVQTFFYIWLPRKSWPGITVHILYSGYIRKYSQDAFSTCPDSKKWIIFMLYKNAHYTCKILTHTFFLDLMDLIKWLKNYNSVISRVADPSHFTLAQAANGYESTYKWLTIQIFKMENINNFSCVLEVSTLH